MKADPPIDPWLSLVGRARQSEPGARRQPVPRVPVELIRLRARSLMRWTLWRNGWLVAAGVAALAAGSLLVLRGPGGDPPDEPPPLPNLPPFILP